VSPPPKFRRSWCDGPAGRSKSSQKTAADSVSCGRFLRLRNRADHGGRRNTPCFAGETRAEESVLFFLRFCGEDPSPMFDPYILSRVSEWLFLSCKVYHRVLGYGSEYHALLYTGVCINTQTVSAPHPAGFALYETEKRRFRKPGNASFIPSMGKAVPGKTKSPVNTWFTGLFCVCFLWAGQRVLAASFSPEDAFCCRNAWRAFL